MTSNSAPNRQVVEVDDGTHRMRIAERYAHDAKLRKLTSILANAQLAFVVFRTFWNLIPFWLGYDPLFYADVGIFVYGVALYPLYRFAFGNGRSQYEKLWAIRAYGFLSVLLFGECFVRFWLYHVQFGPNALDETIASMYPRIPKSIAIGISDTYVRMLVFRFCDVFEKVFDVVGLMASVAGIYFVLEYVGSQREAAEERKEREERQAKKRS